MKREEPHGRVNDFDCIADVYDELVDWVPYERWVDALEEELRKWGLPAGGWILDAACGTGLSTLPWLRKGYKVVGTDASAPMLERARERMLRAGYKVDLFQQSLQTLDLGRQFDAAICMHSGLDYLTEDAELERAFEALRRCLRPGGLLAFDKCLDEPAFYQEDYPSSRRLSCGSAHFEYRWDRKRRLLEQRCSIHRHYGPGPRHTEVVYHLKAVPVEELLEMLTRAGFTVLVRPRTFRVEDPGMGIFRAV